MTHTRSNAFTPCGTCHGMGFLARGDFADRRYVACSACDGCGQVYLDPVPPPPAEAPGAAPVFMVGVVFYDDAADPDEQVTF